MFGHLGSCLADPGETATLSAAQLLETVRDLPARPFCLEEPAVCRAGTQGLPAPRPPLGLLRTAQPPRRRRGRRQSRAADAPAGASSAHSVDRPVFRVGSCVLLPPLLIPSPPETFMKAFSVLGDYNVKSGSEQTASERSHWVTGGELDEDVRRGVDGVYRHQKGRTVPKTCGGGDRTPRARRWRRRGCPGPAGGGRARGRPGSGAGSRARGEPGPKEPRLTLRPRGCRRHT
ncbi:uncharacterized protein LOC132013368 [Mustela nigripes]|uniref:uncharacterized protein LOC132013368 n=1 Tax=Mustela nigripes TaxID=77151 RepID=UPI002815F388|nr:uncharacterized protein LOC132013368 [Mustela nigripes]